MNKEDGSAPTTQFSSSSETSIRRRRHPCCIVGVSTAAGDVETLRRFFSSIPGDSGIGFVIIMPEEGSDEDIVEALPQAASMTVARASDRTPIMPNTIYVAPSGQSVTIYGGVLQIRPPSPPDGHPTLLDVFFRSLAEDQEDNAIAIVLSGDTTHAAIGLRAVSAHGGLVMVASQYGPADGASQEQTPGLALAENIVPFEEMLPSLLEYVRHVNDRYEQIALEIVREEAELHLDEICAILHHKTGHDFSRYKQGTLVRRINRRMQEAGATSVADYVERLRKDPREIDNLFKDLLISVTQFFRDPEAFDVLNREVIPKMFEQKGPEDQIRVWVPGCATGEEAYSIAILLHEYALQQDSPPRIQIFATDIDTRALETARQARYPATIRDYIPQERFRKYFTCQNETCQIVKEIRALCIFSPHNVIKDPPFSRIDLISCRNVMIYLESDLQKRLVPLFHFSLTRGGYLFLGPSESVVTRSEMFRSIDKKHRIFQRKDTFAHAPINFPLDAPKRFPKYEWTGYLRAPFDREQSMNRTIERILIEQYAPASVIINEQSDAVYFSGRTGRYLEPPAGVPSNNIINMARKGLRLELRTAIHKAITSNQEVIHRNVDVETSNGSQKINVIVRPMTELGEDTGLFMVIFQELSSASIGEAEAPTPRDNSDQTIAQQLEYELRATKEHLQTTIEELETSNEELKSSNEELLSMNEELQSANEELQTSKEELQSVNEELNAVNTEMAEKIEELNHANSDLQNLFTSTEIATIFLDNDLRIKKFTPAATGLFHLLEEDIDRQITDIAPRFVDDDLIHEVRAVLGTLTRKEIHIQHSEEDRSYIIRLIPYRTVNNVIDGVVLTAVDVTEMHRAQEYGAKLAAIVESSDDAIIGKLLDGTITSWNQGAERMYGYTESEAIGRSIDIIIPPERRDELQEILAKLRRGEQIEPTETVRLHKDGHRINISVTISPIRNAEDIVVGASAIARDITRHKQAEQALRESEQRFQMLTDSAPVMVWMAGTDKLCTYFNKPWLEFTGRTMEQEIGTGWTEGVHADDLDHTVRTFSAAFDSHEPFSIDYRLRRADGTYRWVVDQGIPRFASDGTFLGYIGSCLDITDRKNAEEAVVEWKNRYDTAIRTSGQVLYDWDPETGELTWGGDVERILGHTVDDLVGGLDRWTELVHPQDRNRFRRRIRQLKQTVPPLRLQYRIVDKTGQIRYIEDRGDVVLDAEGGISRMVGFISDVTEEKAVQEALRISRERLDLVVNSTDIGLWYCDLPFDTLVWNNQCKEHFGLPHDAEVTIDRFYELLHPGDREPTRTAIEQAIAERSIYDVVYRVLHPHGDIRWIRAIGRAFYDGDQAVRFDGITIDITAQKQSEEALQAAATQLTNYAGELEQRVAERTMNLQETIKSLENFTYSIAHDLRAPLRAVQGYTSIILEDYASAFDETGRDYARRITAAAEHMDNLIQDLLAYGRLSHIDLPAEQIDLEEHIDGLLARVQEEIASYGATVDIERPLPSVLAHPTAFDQVLVNLLSNAMKFVDSGTAPHIRIATTTTDGYVRIAIRDNGIGIEPAHQERIFGVFERLHSTARYPGTGIGLAIVRKGIERMGGRVGVQSEPGKGSIFWIELPKP